MWENIFCYSVVGNTYTRHETRSHKDQFDYKKIKTFHLAKDTLNKVKV